MTEKTDRASAEPAVVEISRHFSAARELVFEAWSSAEHLRQWFCPETYTVPEARVEFRVGGAFDICMRSAQGEDHWTRGRFLEIVHPARLVIEMSPGAGKGAALFRAHTVVSFAEEAGGTRLDVVQRYTLLDPRAAPMIRGAPQGWRETLDRLERVVARS
jgi:uncharacterized protein YndB with AHSA1/START domain